LTAAFSTSATTRCPSSPDVRSCGSRGLNLTATLMRYGAVSIVSSSFISIINNSLNQLDPSLEHLERRRHVPIAPTALYPVVGVETEFALALLPWAFNQSRPLPPSRGRCVV
jgi:hypothetical protein